MERVLFEEITGTSATEFQTTEWATIENKIRIAASRGETHYTFGALPTLFVERLQKIGFAIRTTASEPIVAGNGSKFSHIRHEVHWPSNKKNTTTNVMYEKLVK